MECIQIFWHFAFPYFQSRNDLWQMEKGSVWWAPSNTTGTSLLLGVLSPFVPSLSLSPVMCSGLSLSTAAPGASSLSDKHTKGRLHQKVETRTCCRYLEPFWSDGPRTLTQPVPMACDGGSLNTKLKDVKFDSGFHSRVTCLTKCPITISKESWSKRQTDGTMACLHDSWCCFTSNLAMLFRCVFFSLVKMKHGGIALIVTVTGLLVCIMQQQWEMQDMRCWHQSRSLNNASH